MPVIPFNTTAWLEHPQIRAMNRVQRDVFLELVTTSIENEGFTDNLFAVADALCVSPLIFQEWWEESFYQFFKKRLINGRPVWVFNDLTFITGDTFKSFTPAVNPCFPNHVSMVPQNESVRG